MRATQRHIDALLRLDYDTFVNSAFLMQGRADEFTTKTPNQRKQVLATILGLSRWEAYEDRAKQRISRTKGDIQRIDGRLEEIERELARRESHQDELGKAQEAAESIGARLAAAEQQWASLEKLRSQLVAQQRHIDDLSRRIRAREQELAEAEAEREDMLQQADKPAIRGALESVQESLAELDALQQRATELEETRRAHAEEAANLEGINQALGPETEPIKVRVATLKSSREPTCPTCGQALSAEHRDELVKELQAEIEGRREQYRQNQTRITELRAQVSDQERELAGLQGRLRARPGLEKRAGELLAALAHADEAEARSMGLAAKIERWRKELQSDREARSDAEQQARESEKRLREAALTQADLDRLRLEKRKADERVGGARQRLAALDALEEQRQQLVVDRDRLAEDLSEYEDLRQAFSKRGVPAMIIETAVPELERAANQLLTRMTDGRMHVRIETQREIKTGELREALDIIISDELGSRPYELYSGGESFRINFAIRIALSQLLARRAGAQLRSLFIDEGFGTQDARGREHLVSAINSIQEDFDRILVITHIEELKDAFPARIEVTKTPQGSQFSLS
jgi:exonuclease SbcC